MRYGRGYLQKLVQIEFDLPPATPAQLKRMLVGIRQQSTSPPGSSTAQANNVLMSGLKRVVRWAVRRATTSRWLVTIVGAVTVTFIAGLHCELSFPAQGGKSSSSSGVVLLISSISTLVTFLAIGSSIVALWQRVKRRRARALRDRIDVTIREQSAGTTVEEVVENISSADQKDGAVSVREEIF